MNTSWLEKRDLRRALIPTLLSAQFVASLVIILLVSQLGGSRVQMVALCDIGGGTCVDIARPGNRAWMETQNGIYAYPAGR